MAVSVSSSSDDTSISVSDILFAIYFPPRVNATSNPPSGISLIVRGELLAVLRSISRSGDTTGEDGVITSVSTGSFDVSTVASEALDTTRSTSGTGIFCVESVGLLTVTSHAVIIVSAGVGFQILSSASSTSNPLRSCVISLNHFWKAGPCDARSLSLDVASASSERMVDSKVLISSTPSMVLRVFRRLFDASSTELRSHR